MNTHIKNKIKIKTKTKRRHTTYNVGTPNCFGEAQCDA
jgi:hypothetical protein